MLSLLEISHYKILHRHSRLVGRLRTLLSLVLFFIFKIMVAQAKRIYSPTGGQNTESALDRMPPTDALEMRNVFAEPGYIRTRRPAQGLTVSGTWNSALGPVTTHMLNKPDGTQILLAACASTGTNTTGLQVLYNFTPASFAATGANVNGTAATTAASYQMTQFSGVGENHAIIGVNGGAKAWYYTGTGNVVQDGGGTWTITGPTTSADLINVNSYKQRLYFVEKDSASFWYGAVNSYAPTGTLALTEYDVSSFLTLGDSISWVGSTTYDSTYGPQSGLAVVTKSGEVLVFQGDYPASSTWAINGRFFIAPPMGRNAFFYLGQDLHIITKQGIAPFSQLRTYSNNDQQYIAVSKKIQDLYRTAAEDLGESDFYWTGRVFPQWSMLVINLPLDTGSASNTSAFVMNIDTYAWTVYSNYTYETGGTINAASAWFATKSNFYYLNNTSTPFMLTKTPTNTAVCNGASKDSFKIRTAWTGLDSPSIEKKVNLVQPILGVIPLSTTASDGTTTEVDVGIATDFEDNAEVSPMTLNYSKTQGTEEVNKPSITASGLGKMVSLEVSGNTDMRYRLYTTDIIIETGGVF